MRLIKKMLATMLCISMIVPCMGMVALAADGRISFSDPQTAVGEMVDVKCVVRSSGSSLGDVEVTIAYDSESLRFDEGENVTKTGAGTLVYSGKGTAAEATFMMRFQALKEGSAKITVSGTNISSSSGSNLTFDSGNSTVTIAKGDPSKIVQEEEDDENTGAREGGGTGVSVEVNGETYELSDAFEELDIPNGFTETSMNYENTECTMVMRESNGVYLAWLVDSEGTGEFFLFNTDDATFAPFEQVMVSDETSIILLSDDSLELPERYALTKLTLNEKEFPVWQDTESDGYYLMYAINDAGETGLYQYDSKEATYQRYELPKDEDKTVKTKEKSAPQGLVQKFINNHFKLAAIMLGAAFLFLLLILIIVAVKLSHRNGELDHLYDEYGIDLGADGEYVVVDEPAKKGASSRRAKSEDDFDEDNYDEDDFSEELYTEDDFGEDEFGEDDFGGVDFDEDDFGEDDFGEDEFDEDDFGGTDFEDEDDFGTAAFDEEDFPTVRFDKYSTQTSFDLDDFDDGDDYGIDAYADEAADDMIADLDELLSDKKKPSHSRAKQEDSYKIDFIDLD